MAQKELFDSESHSIQLHTRCPKALRIARLIKLLPKITFADRLCIPRSGSFEFVIIRILFEHKITLCSDGISDFLSCLDTSLPRCFLSSDMLTRKVSSEFRILDSKWIPELPVRLSDSSDTIVYYPKYGYVPDREKLHYFALKELGVSSPRIVISARDNPYVGDAGHIVTPPSTVAFCVPATWRGRCHILKLVCGTTQQLARTSIYERELQRAGFKVYEI